MPLIAPKDHKRYAPITAEEKPFLSDDNESTESLVRPYVVSNSLRLRLSLMFNALLCLILVVIGISQYREHTTLNKTLRKCSSYSTKRCQTFCSP